MVNIGSSVHSTPTEMRGTGQRAAVFSKQRPKLQANRGRKKILFRFARAIHIHITSAELFGNIAADNEIGTQNDPGNANTTECFLVDRENKGSRGKDRIDLEGACLSPNESQLMTRILTPAGVEDNVSNLRAIGNVNMAWRNARNAN